MIKKSALGGLEYLKYRALSRQEERPKPGPESTIGGFIPFLK
jgi:hypothetical protein